MSKDQVELYQFASGMNVPNPSPFCMKLEGFFNLANVDYKTIVQNDPRKAPKGKLPYIVHNKQKLADSTLVIEHFKNSQGIDLDSHLSDQEKAVHHAMRIMLDERLYFVLMYNRWAVDENWSMLRDNLFSAIPKILRNVITNKIRSGVLADLVSQGIGRHTADEVYAMGVKDIEALSAYLGGKQWYGGEKPCLLDVCAVSYLANFLIPPIDSPVKTAIKNSKNLEEYTNRALKEIFER